uniref:Uncharacterized protein n=1 Tax=Chromera velia CCMP2878 TaxID=1169474 RepID=A0A0K6S6X0_9ALVE|eukprot:Cvel_19626.t3-p1 / transcript=Cvel_19626.t3 / gene=Cvel_19626 / organism=Chromera_velia_CCMP2878 / gene_product=hypothetical protein / transcript_product=hypothetical protein / location=Cvel_scaffold1708:6671-8444(+) / protein_length=227 / sequence_SO=supercontig / SO=protein_coding / is_pseudo=false
MGDDLRVACEAAVASSGLKPPSQSSNPPLRSSEGRSVDDVREEHARATHDSIDHLENAAGEVEGKAKWNVRGDGAAGAPQRSPQGSWSWEGPGMASLVPAPSSFWAPVPPPSSMGGNPDLLRQTGIQMGVGEDLQREGGPPSLSIPRTSAVNVEERLQSEQGAEVGSGNRKTRSRSPSAARFGSPTSGPGSPLFSFCMSGSGSGLAIPPPQSQQHNKAGSGGGRGAQ